MFYYKLFINLLLINELHIIGFNANYIEVETTSGLVRGSTIQALNQKIDMFLGIPFAEPPIGELRFRRPVPMKRSNEGILNSRNGKVSCIQSNDISNIFSDFPNTIQTEDCLVLNIYTPYVRHYNRLKPVMFWIYGGDLLAGSIFQYDGTFLATHDMVVVMANYRLGTFGFFFGGSDSAPGNQGLYDQRLALLWVKENIHSFGGNPNRITIFGESAGGWSVSAQILSPLAQGLFHRAIIESGVHVHNKHKDILNAAQAFAQAKQAAAEVGCTHPSTWIDCLREFDTNTINDLDITILLLEGTEYLPISAQKAFATDRYNRDVDILAGVVRDEGGGLTKETLSIFGVELPNQININVFENLVNILKRKLIFGLKVEKVTDFYLRNVNTRSSDSLLKALFDFFGDAYITCPTYQFAKQFSKHNPKKSVLFYEFTYEHLNLTGGCDPSPFGICHTSELAYVFGTAFTDSAALQTDIDFSAEIMKLWTNFAKYGNPISDTTRVREWPQLLFYENSPVVKELNPFNFDRIFLNPFKRTCDGFWNQFFV